MALVYNEIYPSDVIIQVCNPEVTGSLYSFGGYMTSFGAVSFDTPTHEQTSHVYYRKTNITGRYVLSDTAVIVQIPTPVREMRTGTTGYLEIGGVKYWCLLVQMSRIAGHLQIVLKMLSYDDGWTNSENLTITSVMIGGHCDFQALTMLDKFNSATGFGLGSRRIIKLLNGEYDDCPSMDMSPGGVSIQGLDNNRNPGKCDIVKSHCSTPTIYLGPKATIATTPVDRVIKLGHYAALDGVKIVVNNATQAAIVNPASDGRNISANNLYVKDYSTQSYPIFTRYTNVGTSIYETQSTSSAFSFDRLSADDLCVITPRGLSINTGDFITIGNLLTVTTPSDSTCYAFGLPSGSAGLQCGNIIAVSLSRPDLSCLFYSPGTSLTTITANTMLIDGYDTFTPAGRDAGPVLVNILAVRESFLEQLGPEIKYNELIVIPDSEKIFLDKYNRDFTVIHPRLLRAGVGINKMPESIIRLGDKY